MPASGAVTVAARPGGATTSPPTARICCTSRSSTAAVAIARRASASEVSVTDEKSASFTGFATFAGGGAFSTGRCDEQAGRRARTAQAAR